MAKRIFNLRNVAKVVLACLVVIVVFSGCEKDLDPIDTETNKEANIVTFIFAGIEGSATIDKTVHTVTAKTKEMADLTEIVVEFTLSTNATATVNGTAQVSKQTANNFTNSVTYCVTSGDGKTTQDWTVTITKEIDNEEFCLYLNSENMDETMPVVNKYLEKIPNNLSDKQKLQQLTEWLKSTPCIIDATILCESCIPYTPKMSEILITFEENGIMKDFIYDIAMANPLQVVFCHREYKPMRVSVKTKRYFTINEVFNFINSLDLDVDQIHSGVYVSNMSSDNLQYILDCLNAKPYTNNGSDWPRVTGYLHYLTNQITIFPYLFNMKNKTYQEDWLQSMDEYKLVEQFAYDHSGYIIYFRVPEGTEKYWVTEFKKYEFVEWAELNRIVHVLL